MRSPLLLLLLAGCPSPDEAFLLSGRVIDENGVGLPNVTVRVLRDTSLDTERCQPLEPFATLETDATGAYALTVFRQQLTLGRVVPRFFRVETSHPAQPSWTSALVFRFPAVDLHLPDLLVSTSGAAPPPGELETFTEGWLDGAVAWRSGVGTGLDEERPLTRVRVDRRLFSDVAEVSAFNMYQSYSLEARLERPLPPGSTDTISRLRGAPCELPGHPCPVTDGRFVPVSLPAGTRELVLSTPDIVELSEVAVHGLQVDGEPSTLNIEVNESGGAESQWRTWVISTKVREVLVGARNHCTEPTGFLSFSLPQVLATGVRLRVEDANGDPLDLTSLSEVSAR